MKDVITVPMKMIIYVIKEKGILSDGLDIDAEKKPIRPKHISNFVFSGMLKKCNC